jgi:alkanesulfonate monooxygenase SsuD/methylene tetrahydromethanopterin reductase-like flavin-dependent oxidoreductase (luciferase family)
MAMEIGIMIAATAQTGDIATIAREVESLGYDAFFIPEHPAIPIGFKTRYRSVDRCPSTTGAGWIRSSR